MTDSSQSSWKIRCICRFDDDDGFTIQCEKCEIWQHAVCVGIRNDQVPDEYLCEQCHPRELDVDRANEIQTRRKLSEAESENQSGSRRRRPLSSSSSSKKSINGNVRNRVNSSVGPRDTGRKPKMPNNRSPAGQQISNGSKSSRNRPDTGDDSETETEITNYQTEYITIETNIFATEDSAELSALYSQIPELDSDTENMHSVSVRPVSAKGFSASKFGIFAVRDLSKGCLLKELMGEIGMQKIYKTAPRNQYTILGIPKPFVYFDNDFSLFLDSRTYANEYRFLRRSCRPNTRIRVMRFSDDDDCIPHFLIETLAPIRAGTELTTDWSFDEQHPIRYIDEFGNIEGIDVPNESIVSQLRHILDSIKSTSDCICDGSKTCIFSRVEALLRKFPDYSQVRSQTPSADHDDIKKPDFSIEYHQESNTETNHENEMMSSRDENKFKDVLARIDRLEHPNQKKRKRKPENGRTNAHMHTSPESSGEGRRRLSKSNQKHPKKLKRPKFEPFKDIFNLRKQWALEFLDSYHERKESDTEDEISTEDPIPDVNLKVITNEDKSNKSKTPPNEVFEDSSLKNDPSSPQTNLNQMPVTPVNDQDSKVEAEPSTLVDGVNQAESSDLDSQPAQNFVDEHESKPDIISATKSTITQSSSSAEQSKEIPPVKTNIPSNIPSADDTRNTTDDKPITSQSPNLAKLSISTTQPLNIEKSPPITAARRDSEATTPPISQLDVENYAQNDNNLKAVKEDNVSFTDSPNESTPEPQTNTAPKAVKILSLSEYRKHRASLSANSGSAGEKGH